MPRPDFRATAARRLSEEGELSPAIVGLLSPEGDKKSFGVRNVPTERVDPSPDQPRLAMDQDSLDDLTASVREHGILQPILVRPAAGGRYQIVAGERRWRAARMAGLDAVPALIEELDDETALEISIIENLQREDLSPLDEALMYERMIHEHGYSVRRLAQKLGKDKGYLENRLRLADAPPEVKELVSVRKDTLSAAYELMKVSDAKKRKRLADQVARGELSLVKLKERIDGRRSRRPVADADEAAEVAARAETHAGAVRREAEAQADTWSGTRPTGPVRDDALQTAKAQFAEALEGLMEIVRNPAVASQIGDVDRGNLAKYLTIAKLKLENTIATVRSGEPRE
ncbi:MAG: ParB/RepB/Spo0J family partition protein [Chloroflexi bacterium]|nr:ParB/RepB/Spo0J family partition protein [Chloroflexota bacterium]